MSDETQLKECSCCQVTLTVATVNFIGYTTEGDEVLWFTCKACTTTVVVTDKYEVFWKLKSIFVKDAP